MAKNKRNYDILSRRERQIMEIVYRLGKASVSKVAENMGDAPSDSALRTLLKILVEKGHLKASYDGPRRIYSPTVAKTRVASSALKGLLQNFFADSREQLFAALLDDVGGELTPEELDRLSRMIEEARKEGR